MNRGGEAAALRTEGQTFRGESLPARLASFVKLPHTFFALPFAGVGVVLASYHHGDRISAEIVAWIVVAFTAARFAAMGFNRLVDRHLDAANPRTRDRELPAGRLSPAQAFASVLMASGIFVLASWMLNPLCGALAPVALAWVFFYSYTKRFTSWSHVVLGFALGIAPVGAYLALAGAWPQPWYALVVLAAAVTCWVAGFDILYALQDLDFDRSQGLRSVPARWGVRGALRLARLLHAFAVVLFAVLSGLELFPVRGLYLLGVAVMGSLLTYEHWIVRPGYGQPVEIQRIDRAFFRVNVAVSSSFFACVLLDRLLLA